MEPTLLALKRRGYAPGSAIDIGAYRGDWTVMFKTIFPATRILMIDALDKMAGQLQNVAARYSGAVAFEPGLLGAEHGKEVRFVEMETGSSVFEESSPYGRKYTAHAQTTLDNLLARHPDFQCPNFIKLDVQGYELEVLRGARQAMQQADFILLEASLLPVNKGCPGLAEVVRFMDEAGFRVLDFCSQSRRLDGVLWQTDLLFINVASPFVPEPAINAENWDYKEA
jgi:FkbM family methyltransferase